jgi:hypothetical protein
MVNMLNRCVARAVILCDRKAKITDSIDSIEFIEQVHAPEIGKERGDR